MTFLKTKSFSLVLFLLIAAGTFALTFLAEQAKQNVLIHLNLRNNLWTHYNSKSLKSKLYELEKNRLALISQLYNKSAEAEAVLNSLAGNLDREISRYRKEQTDIQNEAVRYDTLFEIARRKQIAFTGAATIAQLSLLVLFTFLILRLKKLRYSILSLALFLVAILITAYGAWLI